MGISNGVNNMNELCLTDKNCITCKHFCWWDGDYCCTIKMNVLQKAKKGEFNETIIKVLENSKNCKSYNKSDNKIVELHLKTFNNFLKKYNKTND